MLQRKKKSNWKMALHLAAECYVNPFSILSFENTPKFMDQMNISNNKSDLKKIAHLQKKTKNKKQNCSSNTTRDCRILVFVPFNH